MMTNQKQQKKKKIEQIFPKQKYKTPKLRRYFIEIMGWVFVVGIFAGIWWPRYRWQLIFTALFAIFLALFTTIIDNDLEKEFNQNQKEEN